MAFLEDRLLLSTLYAVGSGVGDGTSHLYEISDYATAPTAVDIGSTGTILDGLSLDPVNNMAYGVEEIGNAKDLYSVNLQTAKATAIGPLGGNGLNALAISSDGTLYGMNSSSTDLYTINPTTGQTAVVFNTGYASAGDLAFAPDGDLYLASATDLVRIDLSDDTATAVGPFGVPDIYGLAIDPSGAIYGAEGQIGGSTAILFKVSAATGAATEIGAIAGASLGVYGLAFENPPAPTITWPEPSDIVYGTALGAAQLDASASVPGTFTYLPPLGTVLNAGAGQTLSVTFTPTDTTDYSTATATATINVLQATPTITWSSPQNINYGTGLGAAQLDATASYMVGGVLVSVPGTFTYTPATGTVLSVGNGQTLSVIFTPTDSTDYTTATATATINVLPGPSGPVSPTRTILRAAPRPAILGRPAVLTATVKNLARVGAMPIGSITFLDGTDILGTVALRRGRASLKTSGLPLGPNAIEAEYTPSKGFGPSTGHMVENVRARRSQHKAAPSGKAAKRVSSSAAMVIRTGVAAAVPAGVAILGGPALPRRVGIDEGETQRH